MRSALILVGNSRSLYSPNFFEFFPDPGSAMENAVTWVVPTQIALPLNLGRDDPGDRIPPLPNWTQIQLGQLK